jgi:hypothetical protein
MGSPDVSWRSDLGYRYNKYHFINCNPVVLLTKYCKMLVLHISRSNLHCTPWLSYIKYYGIYCNLDKA